MGLTQNLTFGPISYCEIVGMAGVPNAPYIGLKPRCDGWHNRKEPVIEEIVIQVNSQAMPRTWGTYLHWNL